MLVQHDVRPRKLPVGREAAAEDIIPDGEFFLGPSMLHGLILDADWS